MSRNGCFFSCLDFQNQCNNKACAKEECGKTFLKEANEVSMEVETGYLEMLLSLVCFVIMCRGPAFTYISTVLCVLALSV